MDHIYRLFVKCIRSFVNLFVVILNLPSLLATGKLKVKKEGEICILGNGPSLIDSYTEILNKTTDSSSVMVVNNFADTYYYETIKPAYYLIVDPAFFLNTSDQRLSKVQRSTNDAIIAKTKWNITLFLPVSAKKSPFVKSLSKNEYIKVHFLRNVAVYDGSERFNRILYKSGLANPPYRNVLIAAIFICIKMAYSKIYLYGADHSWHENLILGKDNRLYVKDKHFFEENPDKIALCNRYGVPVKVHEQLFSIGRALKIYHSLQALSRMLGCRIINRSSKTWIDAFSRE